MSSIVRQFADSWKSGNPFPNVFEFLQSFPDLSLSETTAVLLIDQERRFAAGKPRSIEEYLTRTGTDETSDLALQLVVSEIRLRQTTTDQPRIEEYIARFPNLMQPILSSLDPTFLVDTDNRGKIISTDAVALQETVVPESHHRSNTPGSEETVTYGTTGEKVKQARSGNFGDYKLLDKIAQGGMGVVYKARQVKLNRVVAVKMILGGQLADASAVRRFYSEAEAAGRLQHPGIVSIYEVGEHEGQHFFSMEFVDGQSLAERVRENPLSARKAADLVRQIAGAIEYAHANGIMHRDLKPGNVLLDKSDGVHVTDFGLAKQLSGESELTASGQILGTPSYMPPEQAQGDLKRIGPASDVYSLGAILYVLLTGSPPFRAETPMDTLQLVLNTEPVSPRLVNPQTAKDLETICLKCLQKEAERRYQSARELADDLGRFLNNKPILARPVGASERIIKWIRRKPAVASLIGVVVLAVMGSAIGGLIYDRQRRAHTAELERTNTSLESANTQLDSINIQLARQTRVVGEQRDVALLARERARAAQEDERVARYRVALQLAERDAFKGIELCNKQDVDIGLLWLSRAYGELPQPSVDDLKAGAAEIERADNLRRLITSNMTAWVDRLHKFLGGYWTQFSGAQLFASNNGKLVYQTGGHVLWNVEGNAPIPVGRLPSHGSVGAAAFSPDDTLLATATFRDQLVQLWSVPEGELVASLEHPADVSWIDFSRDGELIATSCRDNFVRFWNASTGKARDEKLDVGGKVDCAVFTDDPMNVIVANNRGAGRQDMVTVWSRETGEQVRSSLAHVGVGVSKMRRSQFWSHFVGGSGGNAVSLWNMKAPTSHGDSMSHTGASLLEFDPMGWTVLAQHDRFSAQVIDHRKVAREGPLLRMRGACWSAAYLTSRRMMVAGSDGEIRMWQHGYKSDLAVLNAAPRRRKQVTGIAYGPGGSVLVGYSDGLLASRRYAFLTGKSSRPTRYVEDIRTGDSLAAVEFLPDGQSFVTANGKSIQRWNAITAEPIGKPLKHKQPVLHLRLNRDGRRLLSATTTQQIAVWDTESGQPLAESSGVGAFWDVAINPDGTLVALAGHDGRVRFWSTISKAFEDKSIDTQVTTRTVDFSPDGSEILAGGANRTIRIFDVETRKPVGRAMTHDSAVYRARFSRDGSMIASSYGPDTINGSIQLWDTATGMPISGAIDFSALGKFAFSPDTKHFLISRSDRSTILHTPGSFEVEPAHVRLWLEVITGLRLDRGGELQVLDLSTWMKRREELVAAGGAPGSFQLPDFEPLPYPSATRPIGTVLPEIDLPIPDNSLPESGDFQTDLTLGPSINNPDYPQRLPDEVTYVLTPDNRTGGVGAVWAKRDYTLPLEIKFQYCIEDDDPWPAADSGSGIAVMFGRQKPSTDATETVKKGTPGYVIHFLTPRQMSSIVLSGPESESLVGRRMYSTFTNGDWRSVRIAATRAEITVQVDGREILHWQGDVELQHGGVGFLASTLHAGSEHKIRAVEIGTLHD